MNSAKRIQDRINDLTWYHAGNNGELIEGGSSESDIPLYKAEDVIKIVDDAISEQEKSNNSCGALVAELVSRLPRREENALIWSPDGDEILCVNEAQSEAIADLLDAIYGGHVATTGFYDEETDGERFGFFYVRIDGC